MARLVTLIESEIIRGKGKDDSDPVRVVRQWWTLAGEIVIEDDPCRREQQPGDFAGRGVGGKEYR
jgi:hypothetical protein